LNRQSEEILVSAIGVASGSHIWASEKSVVSALRLGLAERSSDLLSIHAGARGCRLVEADLDRSFNLVAFTCSGKLPTASGLQGHAAHRVHRS
jgi:hypothetical protein